MAPPPPPAASSASMPGSGPAPAPALVRNPALYRLRTTRDGDGVASPSSGSNREEDEAQEIASTGAALAILLPFLALPPEGRLVLDLRHPRAFARCHLKHSTHLLELHPDPPRLLSQVRPETLRAPLLPLPLPNHHLHPQQPRPHPHPPHHGTHTASPPCRSATRPSLPRTRPSSSCCTRATSTPCALTSAAGGAACWASSCALMIHRRGGGGGAGGGEWGG